LKYSIEIGNRYEWLSVFNISIYVCLIIIITRMTIFLSIFERKIQFCNEIVAF